MSKWAFPADVAHLKEAIYLSAICTSYLFMVDFLERCTESTICFERLIIISNNLHVGIVITFTTS
jgi:hypothetical protein